MIEVLSMKMSKFYKVSKVLGRRTDTDGRVRWAGYGKAYDRVDEEVRVGQ